MSVLVVGLGTLDRGDDAVADLVLQELEGCDDLVLLPWRGDPLSLLGHPAWHAADRVVLVDAARARAGSLRVVGADQLRDEPAQVSSHGLGAAGLVALAEALHPDRPPVVAVAIGGSRFDVGAPVQPATRGAVVEAATLVRALADEGARRVPR